ncbi:MAG: DUF2076 domain-containing protein [Steroidobacteraceae bacterium]
MNSQERALLENFLDQLVQIHGIRKVREADAMIRRAVDRQPDAAYLLVQKSLMLEQALEQAKARIAELELPQQPDRNFLDTGAANAPVPIPRAAATMNAAPPAGAATPAEPPRAGGAGSFLGQAAATAAGVAGGAFLFQGIENLFGPHASVPGQAQSFAPEDVTINNYYSGDEHHAHASDRPDQFTDVDDSADSDLSSGDDDGDFV